MGFRWQQENSMLAVPTGNNPTSLPYTDADYEGFLKSEEWSREETDYLFDLCQRFNYQFVLVADRYEFPGKERSVEDLRERYYQVNGKLSSPGTAYNYDKEGDRHRRLTIESLHARDVEKLKEEALLSEMMSDMRISLPMVMQERQRLLLRCTTLGQQLLAHAQTLPELLGMPSRPRRGSISEKGEKGTKSSNKASNRKAEARKRRQANMATEEVEWYENAPHAASGRKPKPVMANTLVRSINLKPIRVGLTRHVDKLLLDRGLLTKPAVPTQKVCERFDELRLLLARLTEMQRNVDAMMGVNPSGKASEATSKKASRPTSPPPPPSRSTTPAPSVSPPPL